MKTKKELQAELKELESTDVDRLSDSEYKKLEGKIKLVKSCISYLGTSPRDEFVENEKTRLEKVISKIESGFSDFIKCTPVSEYDNDIKKAKSMYNSLMNKSTHNRHLRNINYLLA